MMRSAAQHAARALVAPSGLCLSGILQHVRCLHTQSMPSAGSALASVASASSTAPAPGSGSSSAAPAPAETAPGPSSRNPLLGLLDSWFPDRNRAAVAAAPPAAQAGIVQAAHDDAAAAQPSFSAAPSCYVDRGDIKLESHVVFNSCWRRLLEKYQTHELRVPREVVWLNGAPGSGKGVNTPHILQARGLSQAICLSAALAQLPEARKAMDAGEMISDSTVGDVLLQLLLSPAAGQPGREFGVLVDGFPRTPLQVDFVKLLMDKFNELHARHLATPLAPQFPRASFKMVVLYVDQETSVSRQLQRAAAARARNRRVLDAGVGGPGAGGGLSELRATDVSAAKAAKRYAIFKAHYSAVLRMKQLFPFHLIDAMGGLEDTQHQITQELRYQSSLDLGEATYAAIRHLPVAADLQRAARQQLVSRLDGYCARQAPLFGSVLALLAGEVAPLLAQGALAGRAEWVTRAPLFEQHPGAVGVALDVLCDRGFVASCAREQVPVAAAVDPVTHAVTNTWVTVHRFRIDFDAAPGGAAAGRAHHHHSRAVAGEWREAAEGWGASEQAARGGGGGAGARGDDAQRGPAGGPLLRGGSPSAHTPTITESYIPQHLDLEKRLSQLEQHQQQHHQHQHQHQHQQQHRAVTVPCCTRPGADASSCPHWEAVQLPAAATA